MPPPAGAKGASFWERDTHGEGPALRGRRRVCLRPLLACPEERERDFLFNRGGGWERDNTCRARREDAQRTEHPRWEVRNFFDRFA